MEKNNYCYIVYISKGFYFFPYFSGRFKNITCKIYELNGKYLIDEYIGEDIKCEENLMFDDATNNDLNYDFNKAMLSVVIEVYVLFFSILYILSVMHWRW